MVAEKQVSGARRGPMTGVGAQWEVWESYSRRMGCGAPVGRRGLPHHTHTHSGLSVEQSLFFFLTEEAALWGKG